MPTSGDIALCYYDGTRWRTDTELAATPVATYTPAAGLMLGRTGGKLGFFETAPIVRPASASQAALTDSTGGSTSDTTLAVVPYGDGFIYLSTVGSAVAATGTYAKFPANDAATTAIDLINFTHTSPGRLTYTGTTSLSFYLNVIGTVRIGTLGEEITFNVRKSGTTISAGFAQIVEVDGAGDTIGVRLLAETTMATNEYLEIEVKSDGTSVNVTPLSLVIHVAAAPGDTSVIPDNFAKITRLLNQLRNDIATLGLIKGSA